MSIAEICKSVDEYFRIMPGGIQVKNAHDLRRLLLSVFMDEC